MSHLSFFSPILSLTNSTFLSVDTILLHKEKKTVPNSILILLSVEKCVFSHRFGATALPSDFLPALPLNLTYISTVLSKLSLGSLPYTNSLLSIIWISCPHSVAWVVYPKNPSRFEALFGFHNKFIFYGEGFLAALPTSKLEDHSLSFICGCLFNIFTATLQSCLLFTCWKK
jgi:hypothetical protein